MTLLGFVRRRWQWPMRQSRNASGRDTLVVTVIRIFGHRNTLAKGHASLEQQNQLDATTDGPIAQGSQHRSGRSDGTGGNCSGYQRRQLGKHMRYREGIHNNPHRLFCKVIRMTTDRKEAGGEKPAANIHVGVLFTFLGLQRMFQRLELKMLLISHALHQKQRQKQSH